MLMMLIINNLFIAGFKKNKQRKEGLCWFPDVREDPVFAFAPGGLMLALREFICAGIEPQHWRLWYKWGWFKPWKTLKP